MYMYSIYRLKTFSVQCYYIYSWKKELSLVHSGKWTGGYTIWWISLGKMTLSLLASSNTVGTSTLMPIFGVGFWGVKLFQFFSRLVLLIVSVRKSGKGKEYVLKLLFILILLTVSSIHITLRFSCFQIFLQRVLYKRSA